MAIQSLHRTLEQELFALLRGASLECLVCGEFVLHSTDSGGALVRCPECGLKAHGRFSSSQTSLEFDAQAG